MTYTPPKFFVSFIIPVKDGEDPTNAIRSITQLNTKHDPEYEIIVLDLTSRRSDDANIMLLVKFPNICIHSANGESYALARIKLAKSVKGNILAFMYPDAVCTTPEWLKLLLDTAPAAQTCTTTANLTTHAVVGHGAGLSLQPTSMMCHPWITQHPGKLVGNIPCLRGPLIVIVKDLFLDLHRDITDEVFDGYEDQFLSLRIQYSHERCGVADNIVVYTNKVRTEPVHPFTHYCGLYSLMYRLAFDVEYINLCADASVLARKAFDRYGYTIPKIQLDAEIDSPIVPDKQVHASIQHTNKLLNVKFVEGYGDLRLPPMTSRLKTFGRAVQLIAERLVSNPKYVIVSKDIREQRAELCKSCPMFANSMCAECGCLVDAKIAVATEACPLNPPIWDKTAIVDTELKPKPVTPATLLKAPRKKERVQPKQKTPPCEWCKKSATNTSR
jgi:hypothetical protein